MGTTPAPSTPTTTAPAATGGQHASATSQPAAKKTTNSSSTSTRQAPAKKTTTSATKKATLSAPKTSTPPKSTTHPWSVTVSVTACEHHPDDGSTVVRTYVNDPYNQGCTVIFRVGSHTNTFESLRGSQQVSSGVAGATGACSASVIRA